MITNAVLMDHDTSPADHTASKGKATGWLVPRPNHWHRPLIGLAVVMGVLTLACTVLAFIDPQQILGQNEWFKPLKFAISTGIYAVTMAWLIGQITRRRRLADALGLITTVSVMIEIVIIVGAAALGARSHFNVATPLNTTLWAIMAVSISFVWLATLAVGIILARDPGPDAARNTAVRAGVLLGLIGMALAFLMTIPTASQLHDFQGIAGAHAVGIADGGPGLPFLGWSTVAGDLRIPHFVGLHALQVIPFGLLALEILSRRFAILNDVKVRRQLVVIGAGFYAAVVAILTWQALIGESIIHPSAPIVIATVVAVLASLIAVLVVFATGARRAAEASTGESIRGRADGAVSPRMTPRTAAPRRG